MIEDFKDIIDNVDRCMNFRLLKEPKLFNIMCANKDIKVIQIYSMELFDDDVDFVFCGSFEWKNNKIISHDDVDTYTDNMLVYSYNWWTTDIIEGDSIFEDVDVLDILVKK